MQQICSKISCSWLTDWLFSVSVRLSQVIYWCISRVTYVVSISNGSSSSLQTPPPPRPSDSKNETYHHRPPKCYSCRKHLRYPSPATRRNCSPSECGSCRDTARRSVCIRSAEQALSEWGRHTLLGRAWEHKYAVVSQPDNVARRRMCQRQRFD